MENNLNLQGDVAVLGTGYWGRNLLRNFNSLGVLRAYCDTDPSVLARFSVEYPNAKSYSKLDAMLEDTSIKAVAIATPAATHGLLTEKVLQSGRHVFVEKPMSLEVEEAVKLGRLAKDKNLTLMVGHLLLYHPAFEALQAAVTDGAIGSLRYIYSTRASFGKIRQEENALWSFAPHDISMILALVGRLPKRVVCNGTAWINPEIADTTLSHLDFGDGLHGHIFVSWLHPYKDHRLVVIGEKGAIIFNDTLPNPDKLQLVPHVIGWDGILPVISKAETINLPYDEGEPLRNECTHFIGCIKESRLPRSSAAEGLRVLQVLESCQQSLSSKLPVEMNLIK